MDWKKLDGATLHCQWQYGYGDAYRHTALGRMAEAGFLGPKYMGKMDRGVPAYSAYEPENDYPIIWIVKDGSRRDMVALGQE